MNRSVTNAIRWFMDETVPPVIRDSSWFMYPFFVLAYRTLNPRSAMRFKSLVHTWTPEEYDEYYRGLNSISRNRATDLNSLCLQRIIASIPADTRTLLDAGCGGGYLLRQIAAARPEIELHGLDVWESLSGDAPYTYHQGHVEALPFAEGRFDVVVSSHTLEHIVPLGAAVRELKRVAAQRVLVVVPCQRKYRYTLDEHVNFFTYDFDLVSAMASPQYVLEKLRGDWFYMSDYLL